MNKAQQTALEILAAMPKWQRDYAGWVYNEKIKKESGKVEKLPTKKEVMEELEDDARVFRKHFGKTHDIEIKDVDACNKFKWILFKPKPLYPNAVAGAVFEYRLAPKPPGRKEWVIVKNNSGVWWPHLSRGCIVNGYLETEKSDGIKYWQHWYCPSTGEHSEDWQDEWTPEEFRK